MLHLMNYSDMVFTCLLANSIYFLGCIPFIGRRKVPCELAKVALPGMARAFVPVIPYILITVVVLAFYKYALDTE